MPPSGDIPSWVRHSSDCQDIRALDPVSHTMPLSSDTRRRSRVLFRSGSAAANCMAGALIDACGLATLTPEEETGSPGEVRSQRRLCLPSVDA
jgi:hypothetical protein